MKLWYLAVGTAAALMALSGAAQAAPIHAYRTEKAAHRHCPHDVVVWATRKSGGVFHMKGSRWYGNTQDGAFVCRKEAEDGGWRPARNNQ